MRHATPRGYTLTGVDDPYEQPERAEITLNTLNASPEENALRIIAYLESKGFARPDTWKTEPKNEKSELQVPAADRWN